MHNNYSWIGIGLEIYDLNLVTRRGTKRSNDDVNYVSLSKQPCEQKKSRSGRVVQTSYRQYKNYYDGNH